MLSAFLPCFFLRNPYDQVEGGVGPLSGKRVPPTYPAQEETAIKDNIRQDDRQIETFTMDQLPLSPPSEPTTSPDKIPLNSSIRTTPIHSLLPDIRVPSDPLPTHQYHPLTCSPIEPDDVRIQLEQLRKEFPSPEAALIAQEETARHIKQKLEDAERKREDVQRAMDKKIKERNLELKVLSKYQEGKTSSIAT